MGLMALAVLPAFFLIHYIYKKDQIEKEPFRLLVKLFVMGMLMIIPAGIGEVILNRPLKILAEYNQMFYLVLYSFVVVGGMEEGCKKIITKKIIWNNPNFNYRFDAVLYGTCVSLGFATLENILYIYSYGGVLVAFSRALLSVPMHGFCGVYMGMYMGEAKACEAAGNLEGVRKNLSRSLWIPMILHGFYDFCLFTKNGLFITVFFVFMIIMYLYTFHQIRKSAAADCPLAVDWNVEFQPSLSNDSSPYGTSRQ